MTKADARRRSSVARSSSRALVEPLDARRMLHAEISGLSDLTVNRNAAATTIGLSSKINDSTVEGTVVDMKYNVGTVRVALYDQTQPEYTQNFLRYVDSDRYDDTVVHRTVSSTGLNVVQGGGYGATTPFTGQHIEQYEEVDDNYRDPNTRGTLSLAQSSVNDATSEYFFNTADNTQVLSPEGQITQNTGGFTVFARVVGSGMSIVDQIQASQTYTVGRFEDFPLQSIESGQPEWEKENYYYLRDVTRVPLVAEATDISVRSSKNSVVKAKIVGSRLVLDYVKNKTGSSRITVTTTGVDGDKVSESFFVQVKAQGNLSGTVFYDTNRNRKLDGTESGLKGYRVYLDLDNDGRRDSNELSTFTDDDGKWSFDNLSTGDYVVRFNVAEDRRATTSTANTLTVRAGETNGAKFGVTRA